MKESILIPFLLFFAGINIFTTSCSKDNNDGPTVPAGAVNVTVSPATLTSGPDGGTLELTVKADADWAIKGDADWITIRPSGGLKDTETTVKITLKANDTMDERVASIDIISGGKTVMSVPLTQGYDMKASASTAAVVMGGQESTCTLTVTANGEWTLNTEASWLTLSPAKGGKGDTTVELKASENTQDDSRTAQVVLTCGEKTTGIKVTQMSDVITAPAGYTLVWDDEFNGGPNPGKDWVLENWPAGYVNNELQIYTSKQIDGKSTVEVKDGFLNITCFKASDGKIYSGRINACPSTGWLYGYFEARMLLPKGKGTWPAYWMMPCNVNWNTNPWPKCGEIDIMEEVGANPNYVSSSLHTEKYNHTKGTQITHEMRCEGAEDSFHVYALEWTPDEIITYVDGKVQLRATRASMGADHDCWPFHYAFYPIFNLAWGGDWGGYKGVDDSALPATLKVDYLRIFQKK